MSGFELFVRANQTKEINPPRSATLTQCDEDPKTVIIQLGKGAFGQVTGSSHSFSIQRYMTKQQKELPRP
jgi:hypothetical protein